MSMLDILIYSPILIFVLGFWLYVTVIKRRNTALEALSSIDVQLRQRFDLIPNVLKIAQRFMDHEKALLNEITELRTSALQAYDRNNAEEVSKHVELTEKLSAKLDQFVVQVENYPDLKSDQTMVQAMQTYNEVEAKISASRRFYNSAVTDLNNIVQIFPGSIIASMVDVKEMPYFQTEAMVHEPINASDFLGNPKAV